MAKSAAHLGEADFPGARHESASDEGQQTRRQIARLLGVDEGKLAPRESLNHASAHVARGSHSPELRNIARLLKTSPERLIAEDEAWRRERTSLASAHPAPQSAVPEVAAQIEQKLGLPSGQIARHQRIARAAAEASGRAPVRTMIARLLRVDPRKLATGERVALNRAGALKGRQIVDEALGELDAAGDGEAAGATAPELAELAREALDAFLANPEGAEAWRELGKAGAMIAKALDDIGPAYAEREGGLANG